jgi:hypothetical protein
MDKIRQILLAFVIIVFFGLVIALVTYEAVNNSTAGVILYSVILLIPLIVMFVWRYFQAKREYEDSVIGWVIIISSIMGYGAILYWLWASIHKSVWYGIVFWLIIIIPLSIVVFCK